MSRKVVQAFTLGWKIWAHLCGIVFLSGGIAFGIVQAVSGDAAVVFADDVHGINNENIVQDGIKAKYGGRYAYLYDLDRKEACPGDIVTTFTSTDPGAPAVVAVRKPAVLSEVKFYNNILVDNELPVSVRPGKWNVLTNLLSRCANREQTDFISEFIIEVTP